MKQQVKINQVKGNPNNPRIIKNDKFKKLVKSIKEFPEMLKLRPIVVDEDMMVLGGNMRWKASSEAGLKEVWIEIAEGLTQEQKKEFIVKDNVGFGEWDWDVIANEWESGTLKEWGVDLPVLDDRLEVINGEQPEIEITSEILEDEAEGILRVVLKYSYNGVVVNVNEEYNIKVKRKALSIMDG